MVFRAYYGMPELARADGFPTGALHGWVRSLWWAEDYLKPDRTIVFFDLGGASRQTDLREDYKANRSETPEDLQKQVPVIKDLTRAMGYCGIEKNGVEADDLIGVYANHYADQGDEVFIVSADKDLAQLVKPNIYQLLPPPTANPRLGWRQLDEAGVLEKFGVTPKQIPDYLAIIGDASDNIPGLKGVGPKTAVKWLSQYKNLETIIANSGEINPKRFQQKVYQEADNLRVYLEMTTLDTNHELELLDDKAANPAQAVEILLSMEMNKSAEQLKARLSS